MRHHVDVAGGPNFLVIGAQRSGTTWLATMLGEHPDVYLAPTKEIHFFDRTVNFQRGVEWYQRHFEGARHQRAVGECTPDYLWVCNGTGEPAEEPAMRFERPVVFARHPERTDDIPGLVHRHFPDLRLVVTLRNPVDRAISSFLHQIRMRRVSPRSTVRSAGGRHGILGMGFYHANLLRWMEHFPSDRFLVLLYEEDIVASPQTGLSRVFHHLGVDDMPPSVADRKFNDRTSDPFLYARYYAPRIARRAFRAAPALHRAPYPRIRCTDDDRRWLERLYRADIERLEGLLGRSLDVWRPAPVGSTR